VVLGVIGLILGVVMPYDKTPSWIADAKLYPLSRASATALRALAPKGAAVAAGLRPAYDRAVDAEGSSRPASSAVGQSEDSGYTAAARKGLDDVVEKSR
jgi:hypothetical protein